MHISSVDGQGDLQGASINCGNEDLLSALSPSLTLMLSASPLTLSNSKNILLVVRILKSLSKHMKMELN